MVDSTREMVRTALAPGWWSGLIDEARTTVVDHESSEAARVSAIARLAALDPAGCHEVLAKVLESREPPAVQLAGVRAIAESESPAVAGILLSRLRGFEPSVRNAAIGRCSDVLSGRRHCSRSSAAMHRRAGWVRV